MLTSEAEITRRLAEKDTARSARRAQAATTVGELAARHAELAAQLAELERELGEVLSAAGDVIDLPELAEVTGIPTADLHRWLQSKPARGKRTRSSTQKNPSRHDHGGSAAGSAPPQAAPEQQAAVEAGTGASAPVGVAST